MLVAVHVSSINTWARKGGGRIDSMGLLCTLTSLIATSEQLMKLRVELKRIWQAQRI